MPRYVALLRSVNVAGHGRIAMDELRASFEALGYTDVTTYIQTGNVLFSTASKSETALAAAIEQRLAEDFGDSPAVLLRSVADLRRIGASSPYAKAGADPARHHVTFLATVPSKAALDGADAPAERARRARRRRQGGLRPHAGRLRQHQVHRHLPGAPARRGQHDEELEHGDQALRAGGPLRRDRRQTAMQARPSRQDYMA